MCINALDTRPRVWGVLWIRQTFFYKRAQIFVGDVWGAYDHAGLGQFHDIASLTCFADYRVPQLLRPLNILRYVF